MEQTEEEEYIPKHINYISLPKDEKLKRSYYTYKVSKETQQLINEQGRSIFAEAIFDGKMQVLSNLCIEVLAKSFGGSKLPPIIKNGPTMRLYFSALSIDLPLKKIYCIEEEPFWKRAVLQHLENSALRFRKDINWKNKAISDYFVKLLESKSAEYYPDQELLDLAKKIKGFVTEMHIKHLQSLKESSFGKYLKEKDSDQSSSEDDTEDDFDWNYLITSNDEEDDKDKNFVNYNDDDNDDHDKTIFKPLDLTPLEIKSINEEIKQFIKNNHKLIQEFHKKKEEDHRIRVEYRIAKRIAEEEKHAAEANKILKLKQKEKLLKEKQQKAKKKSEVDVIPSLFEIKLPSDEERILTGFESIEDTRNPELLLKKRNIYKFPSKHCHHIDLSFLQCFSNLLSLTIEFQGPKATKEYHTRHYNVSYQDMNNLAKALKSLPKLKVFRLRNSRLDSRKFFTILNVLKNSNTIEIVDFGNDFLDDNCALPIYLFLKNANCVKSLELEGNKFGAEFLKNLAYGLYQYKPRKLEYLGLARNKIPHSGFHILIKMIYKTNQLKALNITGADIDDSTINCCLTKLISRQTDIENINLLAVPIEYQTSINLESALRLNHKILEMNIRGCGLNTDIEYEIEVLLQRNRYLKENPHLGKFDITEKEAIEISKNKRNPIYKRVLEKFNKHLECLANRSNEFISTVDKDIITHEADVLEQRSVFSDDLSEISSNYDTFRSHSRKFEEPFVYEPNIFDEEAILHYMNVPGPEDRRKHFQKTVIK